MSYVDLKHLLADLALEAMQDPDHAAWAAVAAAYGVLADRTRTSVPWMSLREQADKFGQRFGWRVTVDDAVWLMTRGLLDRPGDAFALRPQFLPFLPYLQRQTSRLLEALWAVHDRSSKREVTDLRRGVALFNAGLYFECHELLESVWRAIPGPDKAFYHGLVQVAAAFYHYEKHNRHGARTLLTKGLLKLAGFPDRYQGIDLNAFQNLLQPWADYFQTAAPPPPGPVPAIPWDEAS
jgi:predicted metal-dependent hydrolase